MYKSANSLKVNTHNRELVKRGKLYNSNGNLSRLFFMYEGKDSLKIVIYYSVDKKLNVQYTINRTKNSFRLYKTTLKTPSDTKITRQIPASLLSRELKTLVSLALESHKNKYLFTVKSYVEKFAMQNSKAPVLRMASHWSRLKRIDQEDIRSALIYLRKNNTYSPRFILHIYRKEKKGLYRILWLFMMRKHKLKPTLVHDKAASILYHIMSLLSTIVPLDYIQRLFLEDLEPKEINTLALKSFFSNYVLIPDSSKRYRLTLPLLHPKYSATPEDYTIHDTAYTTIYELFTLKRTYKNLLDIMRMAIHEKYLLQDTASMLKKSKLYGIKVPNFRSVRELHDKLQVTLRNTHRKCILFQVPDIQFSHEGIRFSIPKDSGELQKAASELSNCLASSERYMKSLISFAPERPFVLLGKDESGKYVRALEVKLRPDGYFEILQNVKNHNIKVNDSEIIADKLLTIKSQLF